MEAKTYEELLDRQRAIAAKIEDGSSEELERERVVLKNAKAAAANELVRIEEKYQDVCKRMETKQAEAKELIEEFKTLDIELRRRRREKFEDLRREEQEAGLGSPVSVLTWQPDSRSHQDSYKVSGLTHVYS